MECPFCTTSLPDDDLFCESCGKPLHHPVLTHQTGCICGAPPEEIDEDGYCGRCGLLARRPSTDHVEIAISANFAGVSDRGLKHQRNEDRFAIRQIGTGFIIVVCDGVSSSTQSELASSSVTDDVTETLEASLRRHSASSPERTVRTAIIDAQNRLAADSPEGNPSTTIVAALVNGLDAAVGWAGDSRAYWIGSAEARQLTADHSWINQVVSSGEISLEQAATAPQAHGITRWLGADAGENANPEVIHFTVPGPGYLLLCTDGLWNYAPEAAQLSALMHDGSSLEIARKLAEFANAQGGHDNVTAVVLRIDA